MLSGLILFWQGTIASIPPGWHLCDGAAGTPDLRDQFIICAKQDEAGVAKATIEGVLKQSGGTVTHNHSLSAGNILIDSTPGGDFEDETGAWYNYPPCYALAPIMKL